MNNPDNLKNREEAVRALLHIVDKVQGGAEVSDVTIENILVQSDDGVLKTYHPSGWRKISITWFDYAIVLKNNIVVESELPPNDGYEYIDITSAGGKTTWMRGILMEPK